MPNEISNSQFLVDESAFRLNEFDANEIRSLLEQLADLLDERRARQEHIGIIAGYDLVECLEGVQLFELLESVDIDRDVRHRCYGLLDKCHRIDADSSFWVNPAVKIAGEEFESYGLAAALSALADSHAIGILAMRPRFGVGPVWVDAEGYPAGELHFVVDSTTRNAFYRSVFRTENVDESRFFSLAALAFPDLRFCAALDFRKFEGSYATLRDVVVEHLSALNDRFRGAYVEHRGLPDAIASVVGIDLSPEGNTRQSQRLMALRDVLYGNSVYRCEWHTKLEGHRNRIHFHPGDEGTDDCPLVGIFVKHLET